MSENSSLQSNQTPGVNSIHKDAVNMHRDAVWVKRIFIISIVLLFIITSGCILLYLSGGISKIQHMRMTVARYDILKSSANFLFLVNETRKIEDGLYNRLSDKEKYKKRNRFTREEFETYASHLYFYKYYYDVNPNEIRAITSSESCWNKRAFSKAGAKGANQMMPATFNEVNRKMLSKFGDYDIYNVYHNTEAACSTWIDLKRWLKWKLKREPKLQEVAWAYNAGPKNALKAIVSGEYKKYLSKETVNHGKKFIFYYRKYQKGEYDVYWEEDVLRK